MSKVRGTGQHHGNPASYSTFLYDAHILNGIGRCTERWVPMIEALTGQPNLHLLTALTLEAGYFCARSAAYAEGLVSGMLRRMDHFTRHCLRTSFVVASGSLSLSPASSVSGRGLPALSAGVGGSFRRGRRTPLLILNMA